MTEVVSLGARRAAATEYADETSPRDMLEQLIADIDSGALEADHFIVVTGRVADDKTTCTRINQAGPFDRYRQIGLLCRATKMVEDR